MGKTDFEAMGIMSRENQDIRMSGTVVEAKSCKQGGLITIGVDAQTLQDIALGNDYHVVLYVVNKKQFNEAKK